MNDAVKAIDYVKSQVDRKEKRKIISYDEFLELMSSEPKRVLRNIFQLFHDMIKNYVGEGEDENPNDPESIGFIKYDCSKIFVNGAENPFFADRLFANRFVRQAASMRHGSQQNRMYVYEGPHGCGKSTFLNNLLRVFEEYTETKAGQSYELFWEIEWDNIKVSIPCNSHDHPVLLIPKKYRVEFLDKLIPDSKDFDRKLLKEKEYEWIYREEVCTVCRSLFWALFDKVGSLDEVLKMVRVRSYKFDRRLGEGISVFNPGDKPARETSFGDRQIQIKLDKIFGANIVKYLFSSQARTNNGVYVLMDVKSNNQARLLDLHNVISEGVHKVEDIEEHINSLFFALMNPEDKEELSKNKVESFQARIQYNKIRYVMEVPTEVKIYRNTFGEHINNFFLPRVLENFARVIISSRMNLKCAPIEEWIPNIGREYGKYCDEYGLLLRMEIYGGVIPPWLSEEDKKKFTVQVRRKIVGEGENEGVTGFSGRDSIIQFGEFFARYGGKSNLITMANVTDFFKHKIGREKRDEFVPKNFISSLVNWYNYVVLNEVKEALYFYNTDQIKEDVLNYLCAVNYELGSRVKCKTTGKEIEVTADFFKMMGTFFTGKTVEERKALEYARDIQKRYVEIVNRNSEQDLTETELYQALFKSYVRNLKEKVLQPFVKNESFREAVRSYGTEEFHTYDSRLKEHVENMIKNLKKFNYNEKAAKEICLYVIDQKLVDNFS